MNVSQFELLFKPQAPATPTGTSAVETVLQGYFLEITNLEDVPYRYAVEFISVPYPGFPLRVIDGNCVYFVDTPPGTDNEFGVLSPGASPNLYRLSNGTILVPAHGTALLAVLPSTFGRSRLDPTPITTPNFEVRGYVRMRLPAVFKGKKYRTDPQAKAPVRVLLTPQHRAAFLAGSNISDQIQTTLPLASGQAENLLPPDPGVVVRPQRFEDLILSSSQLERLAALDLAPADILASLLAGVDVDAADLEGFNASLKSAEIPLAIERRGRASP